MGEAKRSKLFVVLIALGLGSAWCVNASGKCCVFAQVALLCDHIAHMREDMNRGETFEWSMQDPSLGSQVTQPA